MTRERRLGRGLAALLGTPHSESAEYEEAPAPDPSMEQTPSQMESPSSESADESEAIDSEFKLLNVYEIDNNPFQPRRDFREEEIDSLSESLKEHDMLQPVLVRRVGERYQLISGERRLRAAIQAGWSTVPAQLREADDRLVAELAIVENLQRKDLNAIEKALSFKRYLDQHLCSQDDLANRLKINRSTVANLLRLLELPDKVQAAVQKSEITAGHARALLPLGDDLQQLSFCDRIQAEGISVREVERQVQAIVTQEEGESLDVIPAAVKNVRQKVSEQVEFLEQQLRVQLGTKVEIRQAARGRGKIIIHFGNNEEFDRIREQLCDQGQNQETRANAG